MAGLPHNIYLEKKKKNIQDTSCRISFRRVTRSGFDEGGGGALPWRQMAEVAVI